MEIVAIKAESLSLSDSQEIRMKQSYPPKFDETRCKDTATGVIWHGIAENQGAVPFLISPVEDNFTIQ